MEREELLPFESGTLGALFAKVVTITDKLKPVQQPAVWEYINFISGGEEDGWNENVIKTITKELLEKRKQLAQEKDVVKVLCLQSFLAGKFAVFDEDGDAIEHPIYQEELIKPNFENIELAFSKINQKLIEKMEELKK